MYLLIVVPLWALLGAAVAVAFERVMAPRIWTFYAAGPILITASVGCSGGFLLGGLVPYFVPDSVLLPNMAAVAGGTAVAVWLVWQ